MIKVTCRVEDYGDIHKASFLVHSHWIDHRKIEIEIGDEKRIVLGNDLIAAIKNCTNTNE